MYVCYPLNPGAYCYGIVTVERINNVIVQKPLSYNTFFGYFVVQLIQCSLLFGRHRKVVHKGFSVVLFAEINFKMTLSNFHSFLADFFQCVYPFLTTKN